MLPLWARSPRVGAKHAAPREQHCGGLFLRSEKASALALGQTEDCLGRNASRLSDRVIAFLEALRLSESASARFPEPARVRKHDPHNPEVQIKDVKSPRDLGVHDVNERGLWASRSANMCTMASTSTTSTTTPTASLAFRATWEPIQGPTTNVRRELQLRPRVVRRVPR